MKLQSFVGWFVCFVIGLFVCGFLGGGAGYVKF